MHVCSQVACQLLLLNRIFHILELVNRKGVFIIWSDSFWNRLAAMAPERILFALIASNVKMAFEVVLAA